MIWIYCSIVTLLLLLSWSSLTKAFVLKRWYHELHLKQHQTIFQKIYNDVDGFALSRIARTHQDAMEYTYGEIEFIPFIALISMTNPSQKTRFYDLGSGTGKAVIACALVFDMQEYCGIELFNELHLAAIKQQEKLRQLSPYEINAQRIHFIQDDFLKADISKASLIFINATALFGPTWEQLNQRLLTETTIGTTIITTSKPLIVSTQYLLTNTTKVSMSWGVVTAYIHVYNEQKGQRS